MENIKLYSSKFEISESTTDPEMYVGKFVICDFEPSGNDVQLNRDTIEEWLSTLIGKPLVGKVVTKFDGTKDFSSHNVKKVIKKDDFGNEYEDIEFDTNAFGAFFDVGIEEIDGVECITASTNIWKRYSEACEIIKSRAENGELATSWEVGIAEQHTANYMGREIRVIDKGCFLAHCLLAEEVAPAYKSSKLLNVATKSVDMDLEDALINDYYNITEKEDDNLSKKNKEPEVSSAGSNQSESSALTDYDLRRKISEACREKLKDYCWVSYLFPEDKTVWVEPYERESELDYMMFTYEVSENDEVTVSEPQAVKLTVSIAEINSTVASLNADVAAKNETIIQLNNDIQELNTEISNLTPFKEQCEEAERERIEKETAAKKKALKEKLVQSKAITQEEIETSEDIKNMIERLDEAGINGFIVDKIISSVDKITERVTASKEDVPPVVKADISGAEEQSRNVDEVSSQDIVKAFIYGN